MKFAVLAAALILPAVAASAQTTAPTPAPVATPAATPPATTAKFTLDTPIEALVADPAAKAVLAKDLTMDVSQHPAYEMFKSGSLNQVAPNSGGMLTPELLAKISADLATIK